MKSKSFRICVNQPGYLPDSDNYPYNVEADNWFELLAIVLNEYNHSIDIAEEVKDWTNVKNKVAESVTELWSDKIQVWADNLPDGVLVIEVERI